MQLFGLMRTRKLYLAAAQVTLAASVFQLIAYYSGWAQSVTLFGETFHGGGDAITLLTTCFLMKQAAAIYGHTAKSHKAFTYANITLLFVGVLLTWMELAEHFGERVVPTWGVLYVAAIGAAADAFVNWSLMRVKQADMPESLRVSHRANLLHIRQDLWLAGAVVISGLAIRFGIPYLDFIFGTIISCFILLEATGLVYEVWTGKPFLYHVHPSDLFAFASALLTGKKRVPHTHSDNGDECDHHHH